MADHPSGPRIIRTPDQRLRVFVSSTLQEVADERKAAREAITRLRLAPVMFELGARPHPPKDLYRAYLDQSDIFIGIYWQKYGWVAPDMDISGLEDEWRLSGDKPKLIYIKSPAPDREPRLKDLLDTIRADDRVSYKPFTTPDELRDLVENDLAVLLTERFGLATGRSVVTNMPTGTVTFLFTDIEGSTALAQKFPAELPALLARHHAILHQAIQAHNGHVFQITGDAFCAAFYTASDALLAALDAQRGLQHESWIPAPINVRMGIHTGSAQAGAIEERAGGYVGYLTLTRVQRVMSVAHGGQVLLSNPTADLVRGELPAAVALRDVGEHRLKGLLNLEHLWQLAAPDLRQDFPPLQSLNVIPINLPVQLTSFIGREKDIAEVKQRLAHARLLTLIGPGGTGKTRLALQAATELRADFEDRVYFVDLAASRDTEAVLAVIGRTVGLRETSDKPLLDELKAQIKNQKMLSLLDNFEQVTIAAPTMAELLHDCPELKLLVTSREALHVRGENVFPVPPLSLPPFENKNLSLDRVAQCEAVQLFVERAQAVKPDFQLTPDNAQAVAEICARLDGLPLAIELATARLNIFTPQALSERLSNRLKVLRGGARDLPARQQTLHDTVDWSYELLDAGEQRLFALLSVFSGATFEAVEAVTNHLQPFADSGLDILDGVSSLADKSLIRQIEQPLGASRLQMLETVREFASARLEEDPEFSAAAHRAHAIYFADFTRSQWAHLTGEARDAALRSLATDLDNIKSAWRYWAAEGNLEQLGKFTDSLWLLYDARGWYHATVELTTDLLKVLSSTVSTPERAREEIMLQASLARALQAIYGYTNEVEQAYAHALELCDKAGEIPELFPVLRALSSFYLFRADFEKSAQMGQRILSLAERLGDDDMKVEGHTVLGTTLAVIDGLQVGLDHLEKAIAAYEPARHRARRLGLGANTGVTCLTASAIYLYMSGYPDRARRRAGEAIGLALKLEHPFSICYALFHYGLLQLWLGNSEIARERAEELIKLAEEREFQVWRAVGACLRGIALVRLGSVTEGVPLIDDGMRVYQSLRTPPLFWPLLLLLQAEAYGAASRPADGLTVLNEAIQIAAAYPGKSSLASEFMGLKGDLLIAVSPENTAEAEVWLHQAVNIAQEAQAPMLELRAALRLSRLWQQQGKTEMARTLLSEAYAKMTEGFTLPDLVQAQALLKELA